jgi:hypothetical protein
MTEAEWSSMKSEIIYERGGINNEEDLRKFVTEEQARGDWNDKPQY